MVAIFVDGDACPVKDETLRVAARHEVLVHLVSNQWLRGEANPLINRVVVERDARADDVDEGRALVRDRALDQRHELVLVTGKTAPDVGGAEL